MKKLLAAVFVFLMLGFSSSAAFVPQVLAVLSPFLFVTITNPQPNSPTNLDMMMDFAGGSEIPTQIDIGIPSGFQITPSASLPDSTVVAIGFINAFISGTPAFGTVKFYNTSVSSGTSWRMEVTFPDFSTIEQNFEINVTGNSQTGYS